MSNAVASKADQKAGAEGSTAGGDRQGEGGGKDQLPAKMAREFLLGKRKLTDAVKVGLNAALHDRALVARILGAHKRGAKLGAAVGDKADLSALVRDPKFDWGEEGKKEGGEAKPGGAGAEGAVMRKAAAAPQSKDPSQAFDQATQSGGDEIPHREEMEQAFGHDFSNVRAHTGQVSAMEDLGAHAATRGEKVAFASSSPDKALVAHELTHVVQERLGRGSGEVQRRATVSHREDPAEREADAVAPRAAAGERVQVGATPASAIHRSPLDPGLQSGGPSAAEIAEARRHLTAAKAILADKNAPLSDSERAVLQAAVQKAEAALASYMKLAQQGKNRNAAMGGFVIAGGGILADDATVVGVADDPLLILIGLGMVATMLLTKAPASNQQLAQAWGDAARSLQQAVQAGAILIALKLKGDQLRGNTERLAEHLARLLALTAVAGVPSGEPPKKGPDDDKHWWTEIKAFLKNVRSAIGQASRKQVMRELQKRFTEEQIREIEQLLAKAAKMMGEGPPSFLPPP